MRAIAYTRSGPPDTLRMIERPVPRPGPGEVRVDVRVSGVNPIDVKRRASVDPETVQVPHYDGAGVIDAVGEDVATDRVGQRVWLWGAAWQRADGTAQEQLVIPAELAVALPDSAGFAHGASLGIPALTAHRTLTLHEDGPRRLGPGALSGRTVLVAGGAGAVGHAAIQLAVWSGATVVATVSSSTKAELATAAGAHHVLDYRTTTHLADAVRDRAPSGVDTVVEVAVAANGDLDRAVLADNGVIAFYGGTPADAVTVPVLESTSANRRWHGVFLYGIPAAARRNGLAAVFDALDAGALPVGAEAGLPLHLYPLDRTAEAHQAVEDGVTGKVLVDLTTDAADHREAPAS
ncbi:NADPH:quinone reductase [Streptomyces sp. enrichment culture]|uniref:NADPH:quinone reductase n=1 Tax=Streptomyces sp. enrichment culture TaxID=1795815 RepID=UPI003F55B782